MLLGLIGLGFSLYSTRKDLAKANSRIRALNNKIKHEKKVIKKEKRDIKALATALKDEEKGRYDAVLGRNAVSIDHAAGCLVLKRPLEFAVPCAFSNPEEAKLILDDV